MSDSEQHHEENEDRSLLDQTLYLARRIYDDPHTPPISLDIHSACAIGSYECVKETIESGISFNARNKGNTTHINCLNFKNKGNYFQAPCGYVNVYITYPLLGF